MSPDPPQAKSTQPAPKDVVDNRKLKPPPADLVVKCPRCDSPNTKFCYYNNYSLSQPRHFCKTCRRYWTKGGALRNVPIGGGCRKNKKMKQMRIGGGGSDNRSSSSCEIMGSNGVGLNFFQGFLSPSVDFQLGPVNNLSAPSTIFPAATVVGNHPNFSLYDHHQPNASSSQVNACAVGTTLMGFNYLKPGQSGGGNGDHQVLNGVQQMASTSTNNSMIVHGNLASSIESLSSINQELHWKLQQQRLAVMFEQTEKEDTQTADHMVQTSEHQIAEQQQSQTQKFLQPILFQNLETARVTDHPAYSGGGESRMGGRELRMSESGGGGSNSATEWFYDGERYGGSNNDRSNNQSGMRNEDHNMVDQMNEDSQNNHNWNRGIQAWSDLQHFDGAMP